MSKIGHNGVAGDQLVAYIERIERLETEEGEIAASKKDVYAEAKGNGFDVPTMKKLVAMRKKDKEKLEEENGLLGVYMSAIGMQLTLPGFSVGGDE
jgi:uncharacterized protein (UPF0335 family)